MGHEPPPGGMSSHSSQDRLRDLLHLINDDPVPEVRRNEGLNPPGASVPGTAKFIEEGAAASGNRNFLKNLYQIAPLITNKFKIPLST